MRRKYLSLLISLSLLFSVAIFIIYGSNNTTATETQEIVKFAIFSDWHLRNTSRAEIPNLTTNVQIAQEFLNDAQNNSVDFIVVLGDFVDSQNDAATDWSNESEMIWRINKAKQVLEGNTTIPIYYVIGNHENKMPQTWNMTRIYNTINSSWYNDNDTWYYFDLKGYRFIVLNTCWSNTDGTIDTNDHQVPGEEIQWLSDLLNNSDMPVIVFMHCPLTGGDGTAYDSVQNASQVIDLLNNYPYFVAGFFGHSHHNDNWDRLLEQDDAYGNKYYHTPSPHEWMEDTTQHVWSIVEINPYNKTMIFRAGSGVTNPAGYQTEWFQIVDFLCSNYNLKPNILSCCGHLPGNNISIPAGTSLNLSFNWGNISNPVYYKIWVYSADNSFNYTVTINHSDFLAGDHIEYIWGSKGEPALPPGNYTIRVKCIYKIGVVT